MQSEDMKAIIEILEGSGFKLRRDRKRNRAGERVYSFAKSGRVMVFFTKGVGEEERIISVGAR